MTFWRIAALVVFTAVVRGGEPGQVVYRSRADVVAIDVAVHDGRRPVTTLTASDFELRDNGVVQTILDFDRARQPLDLTVTVDVSGSMTPAERLIVQRAVEVVGFALGPTDRGAVVTFARGLAERMPLGPPPLKFELSPVATDGMSGTAVTDALLLALVTAPVPDRRQLGLFMTDGEDNSSYFDATTVVETLKYTTAQMCVVLARDNGRMPEGRMLDVFKLVARDTGGELLQLGRNDDLGRAFLTALENFRMSYVLRYTPTGIAATGWHDVTVRLKSNNYTVRARRGYSL